MRCPLPLAPGDRVVVVAPSGPFDQARLDAGLARLEQAPFELVVPSGLRGRTQGFFAGSDVERAAELADALADPRCRGIWVARGGYGSARLLGLLDTSRLQSDPPWLIGFSDATVLHQLWAEHDAASLHAPNLTGLAGATEEDFQSVLQSLTAAQTVQRFSGLRSLGGTPRGRVQGPVRGGNLTVLFTEAASGRLHLPPGSLLLLEDVNETSYRVDRMLTALAQGGHFENLGAILLGEFTDCSAGRFDVSVESVLAGQAEAWGVPVLAGLPIGHGARNCALLHGGDAELDGAAGTLLVTAPRG